MSETVIKPLLYGVDFDAQTRVLSFKRKDGAEIYSCTIPEHGPVDDINKPLMFRAIEDNSSVTLNAYGNYAGTFKTSTDAETWENYVLGTEIPLNADDCVFFKVDDFGTKSTSTYCQFSMTGKIEAWHNANSMASGNFASLTDLSSVGSYTFDALFSGCTSLVKAPLLPATTLAPNCYIHMFWGCTGLAKAPALPATTLANRCYSEMFFTCRGLTQAPALPATTLSNYCYSDMFSLCTGLTQAPALPATTLAQFCYNSMFSGCSGLNEVTCLATDVSATNCTTNWLSGVSASGDFYTPQATDWSSGASGIPTNWTRHDL